MTATIPNLWSPDIKLNVLTPVAILRAQAGMLSQMTKGLLEAEVIASEGGHESEYALTLIAPALEGYRHQLVVVRHNPSLVYPATLEAECFGPGQSAEQKAGKNGGGDSEATALSDNEFTELLRVALQSPEVNCVVLSLIARSNEAVGKDGNGYREAPEQGPHPSE